MTLVIADLSAAIMNALGPPKDKNNNNVAATAQTDAYAAAVINTLKAGKFAHASGTVQATGANGLPVTLGLAVGGVITGLLKATWIAALGTAFTGATGLDADATASVAYLMTGLVGFASGSIVGVCTSTPTVVGVLQNGAGTNGKISGLTGAAWNTAVGVPGPLGAAVYGAIANYLIANATCTYAAGSVTGAFPAAGGAMTLGTGINGAFT